MLPSLTALSDAALLDLVRDGEETAFTELYARHREVALRMAAVYAPRGEADDLVDLAFEKVLGALRRGRGPNGAFRAYLFVTLRRLAAEQAQRRPHEQPLDELPEAVVAAAGDPDLDPLERQMITSAFESLPGRWQAVLWHTAVEGRHPRELATILGVSANAVSALAYRAREKLRQAYLQAHLRATPHPECEPHRSSLGAYVREAQSRREARTTREHVDRCPSCQNLLTELHDVNRLLARAVLPIFMVAGAGGPLAGLGAGSFVAGSKVAAGAAEAAASTARRGLSTWVKSHQIGSAVGAAAAAAALAIGLAEVQPYFPGGQPEPARVAESTESSPPEPVAEAPLGELAPAAALPCPTPQEAATDLTAGILPPSAAPAPAPAPAPSAEPSNSASAPESSDPPDPGAAASASSPTTQPAGVGGLGSLVQSLLGVLGVHTTTAQPPPTVSVLCTPGTEQGHGELTVMVGGGDGAGTGDDQGADPGVLDQLPLEAEVTIDLSDGLRLALQAGLPAGCELTEDGQGLRCLVSSLLPGLPAAQLGVEVLATEGQAAATITVSDGDKPLLTQTVDLSALTQSLGGLLGSGTTSSSASSSSAPSSSPLSTP